MITFKKLLFASLTSAFLAPSAYAGFISDNYTGADGHGYGDRIGGSSYEIFSMTAEKVGSILTVSIHTNFAGLGDNGLASGSTLNGFGIGYGDLFLADEWKPVGAAPYDLDDHSNGTVWDYGFALDDRYMDSWVTPNGTGKLYSLNSGDNATDTLLSEAFMKPTSTFRNGQEVAVNTNSTGVGLVSSTDTWSINNAAKTIDFVIDLAGTDLENVDNIALHWGMLCGNDVIEGYMPEPSILLLMGSGLIGFTWLRRRKHV